MRRFLASSLILVAAGLAFAPAQAQQPQQAPMPPGGFKPPPAAPVKPYKPLAVKPPGPFTDAAFAAFRKQLADVTARKDRAALGKLVVAKGFFWLQDKDMADKRKPGIDNLAKAVELDAKDGSGWETLSQYAEEPTAEPLPDQAGVICAPAEPDVDQKAFEALFKETQTEPPEWAYPTKTGIEVRGAAQPKAAVVETLGMYFVRVLSDTAPPADPNQPAFLHIALPSGKTGFVPAQDMSGLGGDQMCYSKDAGGWKITGYLGGAGE